MAVTGGGTAGDGAAAVVVAVWAGGVGALLDELMVVLDCGCCHGRHSSPITTSNSNTAATETPISLRVTEPTESLWPVAPTVLEGPGVTWGLRAAGRGWWALQQLAWLAGQQFR